MHYVYEAGAIKKPGGKECGVIEEEILEKERAADFSVDRLKMFLYRTRYYTDSVIIGSKGFVSETYQYFKDIFQLKCDKKPNPVHGIKGFYSLKRFSEP